MGERGDAGRPRYRGPRPLHERQLPQPQRGTPRWVWLIRAKTQSPVLPCFMLGFFFKIVEIFADWQTRVKQIAKLWRKASSQDRAPYVVRTLTKPTPCFSYSIS